MAENNNTTLKEPVYLSYGDQLVNLADFLTGMANEVNNYVNNLPWSYKKKLKFMEAYTAIMNQGVTGASIKGGQWHVNHNGTLDIPEEDRLMYEEAAYFILLQMSNHVKPTESSTTTKKSLTHNDFITGLQSHIGTEHFGGRSWTTSDDWDILDPREKNGVRGTEKRANLLSKYLQSYASKINEDDYDFTDSPFGSYEEFLNRINNAVRALGTKDNINDDIEELNRLGIRYKDWFNNGTGDPYTKDPNFTGTYGQYYNEYLPKLAKLKATELVAKPTIYSSTLKNTGVLYSRRELADKYGSTEGLLNLVQLYMTKGLNNLTNKEKLEISSAMAYGANTPVSDDEWIILLKVPSLKGSIRNRFKKINGIDNLIYDTATRNTIHLYDENFRNGLQSDFLAGESTKSILLNYLNSTEGGFTPAERNEVIALLLDLGAAADPEGVSSTILSQAASVFRDYNRGNDPEGWTLSDTGWAALDHGLGALSLIPVVGGWLKGTWALSKLGKYLPKMERAIRLMGRAGSTYAMATNASGALNTLNKIKNGEDLSLKDYQDLAYFFIGGLGHHLLNRGNRIERTAMKARGLETTNTFGNKSGFTRTKAEGNTTSSTLKIKVKGEDMELEISPLKRLELESRLSLKKNNTESKSEVIREDAEIKEAIKKELQAKGKSSEFEDKDIIINYEPSLQNARIWRLKFPEFMRTNKGSFGEITNTKLLNWNTPELFEANLAKRSWWDKFTSGSNRDIRRYDRNYLGNNYPAEYKSRFEKEEPVEVNGEKIDTYKPITSGEATNTPISKGKLTDEHNVNRTIMKRYKDVQNGKFSKNKVQDGLLKIGDEKISIYQVNSGSKNPIIDILTSSGRHLFKSLEEAKKFIAQLVKELKNNITKGSITRTSVKEMGKVLLELKRKGWLKQGGKIDKLKIQMYKNYINK